MSTAYVILSVIVVGVLAHLVRQQHKELARLDEQLAAFDAKLAKTEAELHQLELLAQHLRQYDVIGLSVFPYISAFHPTRQN